MTLSVCCLTADPGPQVRELLAQVRPVADEIVVAADRRVPDKWLAEYAAVADRLERLDVHVLERHIAWLHARCEGDWILRLDGDEVVSTALLEQLPDLVRARDVVHYAIPRRWLYPDEDHWLEELPWWPDYQLRLVRNDGLLRFPGLLHTGPVPVRPARYLDAPIYHLALLARARSARPAATLRHEVLEAEQQAPGGGSIGETYYRPEEHSTRPPAPVPDVDGAAIAGHLGARPKASATRLQAREVPRDEPEGKWAGRQVCRSAYRALIQPFEPSYRMSPREERQLFFRVTNRGTERWHWDPELQPQIRAAYRWRQPDRGAFVGEGGRTAFPCEVAPGDRVILPLHVRAPDRTGRYLLEVDLIHEQVRWFGEALRVPVEVATGPSRGHYPDDGPMQEPAQLAVGVNLAGYLDSLLGVGEAGRQVGSALEAAGVPVARFNLIARDSERLEGRSEPWPEPPPFPVNLVCVNPDGLEGAHDELGPSFFEDRYTVGLWWWEVDAFPERFMRAFDLVDEVWVGSHHVADALAAVSPVPVVRMALPVAPEPGGDGELSLPEGFLFLFAFDYGGVFERKNPLAVVEAFKRAFPPGSDASLVLKCVGAERHPVQHERLLGAHPDVTVIDRALPPGEMAALMEAADCYVSLHRSEGFGLPIAEAMLRGKPVIATNYGGPRDYLSPANSFPVDFSLVPIGEGNDPYPAGGRWAEPDLDQAAALMRRVREEPEEAARRAERGRADLLAAHSPAAAGAAMARRLAMVARLPSARNGAPSALDTAGLLRRVRGEPPEPAPESRGLRLRRPLRRAMLRLIRPQAVHQRLVDEEIARLLATLDERIQGLAASQASLGGELAELRRRLEERE